MTSSPAHTYIESNVVERELGSTVYGFKPKTAPIFNSPYSSNPSIGTSVQITYKQPSDALIKLNSDYIKERKRLEDKGVVTDKTMIQTFHELRNAVDELPFEKCAVELSVNNSVKISLVFSKNRMLMLTKPVIFDSCEIDANQIFYSYFIDNKLISSDVTEFAQFIQGFKEYIKS